MKNANHENVAQALALSVIAHLDRCHLDTPHPDALKEYIRRHVEHHYTTRHPSSRRAVANRVLQIVSKERAA